TLARNMPQFGMLMMLTIIPLQLLSGGSTPRESMPELVQNIMLAAPTTHFVELGQAILYRGAGLETVWKPFLALALIGAVMFAGALLRVRKAIARAALSGVAVGGTGTSSDSGAAGEPRGLSPAAHRAGARRAQEGSPAGDGPGDDEDERAQRRCWP